MRPVEGRSPEDSSPRYSEDVVHPITYKVLTDDGVELVHPGRGGIAHRVRHDPCTPAAGAVATRELLMLDLLPAARPRDLPRPAVPSLSTSGETLTIRDLLTLRARTGACWDVAGERTREECRRGPVR